MPVFQGSGGSFQCICRVTTPLILGMSGCPALFAGEELGTLVHAWGGGVREKVALTQTVLNDSVVCSEFPMLQVKYLRE